MVKPLRVISVTQSKKALEKVWQPVPIIRRGIRFSAPRNNEFQEPLERSAQDEHLCVAKTTQVKNALSRVSAIGRDIKEGSQISDPQSR